MVTFKYNGNYLEMHNDINMPIEVYTNYNRLVMIDSGVGGTLTDLDNHITKALRYIDTDDKKKATDTLMTLRQAYSFIMDKTNPELLSFAALVHSINGKVWTDQSDDGLKRLIDVMAKQGLTIGKVQGFLNNVKKNLKAKFQRTFQRQTAP